MAEDPDKVIAKIPASPETSPEPRVAPVDTASTIANPEEEVTQENRHKSDEPELSFSAIKADYLNRRRRFEREVKLAWQEPGESTPTLLSQLILKHLFVDKSFPPDISSLSYVYSGEDKYEKMVFKRPWEIDSEAVFSGVGGTCQWPFPWIHWRDKGWFQGAMAIISLSVKCLEKLIPGYKKFAESFQEDYFGAFLFRLWRFGRWQEVVIDDYLPLLDNEFAYCGPVGERKEFWAALLEKAYAKCNRTYESIENGNILDALTDLTGAICEYFTPDVNPPHNLFRLLNISCSNRSLIVCWRSEKRLTPIGFIVYQPATSQTSGWKTAEDNHRYLHIVTAATKFQTTDGRMLEMVRLKCPFPAEPKWCGRFSESDKTIWETINQDFMERYQPLQNKDEDEYWLTVEDFRCNFGSMIICSNPEPYVQEGLNVTRKYNRSDQHFILQTQHQTPQLTKTKNSSLKIRSWSLTDNYPTEPSSAATAQKLTSTESLGYRKISPENTPRSVDSTNEKVFQYDPSSSPIKSLSPELLPSKKSPITSPPFAGVRRKISYQPPRRSPLASEASFDEQSIEANTSISQTERHHSRPMLRRKSSSPSKELLHEYVTTLSLDSSVPNLSVSSKNLLSPFAVTKDSSPPVSEPLFSSDRTPPTSPKSEDEGIKKLTKSSKRGKTSRSLDEISRVLSPSRNPFVSPTLRPKSISLRQSHQMTSGVPSQLKEDQFREMLPSDDDSLIPGQTSAVSSPIKARHSVQLSSSSSVQDDRQNEAKHINRHSITMSQPDESPSSRLSSNKDFVKSKNDVEMVRDFPSPSSIDVSSCHRRSDADQKDKQKGKIIFKSCISTDEEDEDISLHKKSPPKTYSRRGSRDQSGKRHSISEAISVEQVLLNRNVSGDGENRNFPGAAAAAARLTSQGSQVGDVSSDFGSLVQIVKKVRIKSGAAGRMMSAGQDPSMSQGIAPNRKLGRYERLALFCHSSSDGSQGVPSETPIAAAVAAAAAAAPISQDSNLKPAGNQARKISLGAISTLSESNFIATKMDRFSPTGGWSQLVSYHGTWHKRKFQDDIDQCPRVLLTIPKLELWKTDLDPAFSGRSHVIISLLQDYRHGSSTANSLLQPIGFKFYKTKYPEKDEKRALSKLNLVCNETSNGIRREVVKRINLEHGNYFIVPYCPNKDHEGEFIVRILGERSSKEDKPDWYQNILRVLTSVANNPAP